MKVLLTYYQLDPEGVHRRKGRRVEQGRRQAKECLPQLRHVGTLIDLTGRYCDSQPIDLHDYLAQILSY